MSERHEEPEGGRVGGGGARQAVRTSGSSLSTEV